MKGEDCCADPRASTSVLHLARFESLQLAISLGGQVLDWYVRDARGDALGIGGVGVLGLDADTGRAQVLVVRVLQLEHALAGAAALDAHGVALLAVSWPSVTAL
jgi:hypothetical protein